MFRAAFFWTCVPEAVPSESKHFPAARKKAYLVENGRDAVKCIQANLHKTHFEETGVLLKMDVLNALHHIHEKQADIIYLDPPYQADTCKRALLELSAQPYVTEDTLIIVETALDTDFFFLEGTGLEIVREKDYRSQRHLFIKRKSA